MLQQVGDTPYWGVYSAILNRQGQMSELQVLAQLMLRLQHNKGHQNKHMAKERLQLPYEHLQFCNDAPWSFTLDTSLRMKTGQKVQGC